MQSQVREGPVDQGGPSGQISGILQQRHEEKQDYNLREEHGDSTHSSYQSLSNKPCEECFGKQTRHQPSREAESELNCVHERCCHPEDRREQPG